MISINMMLFRLYIHQYKRRATICPTSRKLFSFSLFQTGQVDEYLSESRNYLIEDIIHIINILEY